MSDAVFQEQTPLEREDELYDNNEQDEDLLAVMAENPSEVPNDDMEEDDLIDDSLSPLERIFLSAKSEEIFHRVFIARELPMLIKDVEVSDAVEYVLPLMNSLGTDPDDAVREAFAPELDKIIWFYYSHCPIKEPTADNSIAIPPRPHTPQRPSTPRERPQTSQRPQTPQNPKPESSLLPPRSQTPSSQIPALSPQAFTPLLHALLLDQNTGIATAAQNVVLSLVEKILEDTEVSAIEKEYLERETLEGVVLGIGRLDQERAKREEMGEWDNDNDEQSIGGVAGSEEEAELGRMTMMSLISSLASIVGPERSTRLFIPELDKLADEPVFYVRKEAAMAVGGLARVVPLDIITSKLLPIYDHFSTDPIWHVRRSCCIVLPTICSRLSPEMKADRATKGIDLFAGDVSRSVRSAAGEIIGELIATFQPEGDVPEKLVQHFLSLGPGRDHSANTYGGLSQKDPERQVICAYNFPAIVLTLGAIRWDDLKETYASLTRDIQIKVRRSLACSLHEIAKVVGPQKTEQDLLSVFAFYLVDIDEVRSGLMEHLAAFIECLPQNTRNEYLPKLNDVWDGVKHQWRLRDEIAKQIPALCRLFDGQNVINHILPLTIRAARDEVASVRQTAVRSFPDLFDVVRNEESSYKELINHVKKFSSDAGFRGRVVYAQICNGLMSNNSISKTDLEAELLPRLEPLASDRVVNVRIAVGRLVGELCRSEKAYPNSANRPKVLVELIKLLAQDSDADVKGFVNTLLPPEERSPLKPTSKKLLLEKTGNGLASKKEEKEHNSKGFNQQEEGTMDMAIDEPGELENASAGSSPIMGDIPIAFIGRSDSMEIDMEIDENKEISLILSNSPPSPNLNDASKSFPSIVTIETDQTSDDDVIPIIVGSESWKLMKDKIESQEPAETPEKITKEDSVKLNTEIKSESTESRPEIPIQASTSNDSSLQSSESNDFSARSDISNDNSRQSSTLNGSSNNRNNVLDREDKQKVAEQSVENENNGQLSINMDSNIPSSVTYSNEINTTMQTSVAPESPATNAAASITIEAKNRGANVVPLTSTQLNSSVAPSNEENSVNGDSLIIPSNLIEEKKIENKDLSDPAPVSTSHVNLVDGLRLSEGEKQLTA
ncbi:hypothetical protein G9A89_004964 [Geosiphon pyriformis]|nr:hypothetical protein G9A89_004964 [Geosiphon pyriformis]